MKVVPRTIRMYSFLDGVRPFENWHDTLRNQKASSVISARIDRLRSGNLGKYRMINGDLSELKIHLKPGYRVYFSELEGNTVLLLWGGVKGTQKRDIEKAQSYLAEFRSRQK